MDERVLAHWRAHGVVPSDVDLEFYEEIYDALTGRPDTPADLLVTLRKGFD